MARYQQPVLLVSVLCFFLVTVLGCAPAVVVKEPPAPRVETQPPQPFPNSVWIDGHWQWNASANDFVWVSGHWAKAQPGKTWVKGHWQKTPRGWKWVKGQWR